MAGPIPGLGRLLVRSISSLRLLSLAVRDAAPQAAQTSRQRAPSRTPRRTSGAARTPQAIRLIADGGEPSSLLRRSHHSIATYDCGSAPDCDRLPLGRAFVPAGRLARNASGRYLETTTGRRRFSRWACRARSAAPRPRPRRRHGWRRRTRRPSPWPAPPPSVHRSCSRGRSADRAAGFPRRCR